MADLIWVQPGRDDGRVALSEKHRDHPDGEAWVATTGTPVQVARTLAVERKLARGALVEVDAPKAASKEPLPKRKTKAEIDAEIAAARGETIPTSSLAGLGLTAEQQRALTAAGYADRDALTAATDDDLIAVTTIGKATVESLRAALAELAA